MKTSSHNTLQFKLLIQFFMTVYVSVTYTRYLILNKMFILKHTLATEATIYQKSLYNHCADTSYSNKCWFVFFFLFCFVFFLVADM